MHMAALRAFDVHTVDVRGRPLHGNGIAAKAGAAVVDFMTTVSAGIGIGVGVFGAAACGRK